MNDSRADPRELSPTDDSSIGLEMFVIFTTACLLVTGAVALLALLNTWWVLGLAFGIHVIMTAAVGFAIFSALRSGALTMSDQTPLENQTPPQVRAGGASPAAA